MQKGACDSPQDNREKGESPLRSRRCKRGVVSGYTTEKSGRSDVMKSLKSEDLPFCTDVYSHGV